MRSYTLTDCVVCGSAGMHVLAEPDDIRAEVETLWAFHGRRLAPTVPPERLLDRVAFTQDPPWRVVRCDHCGLVFRNPVESAVTTRARYARDDVDPRVLREFHDTQLGASRSLLRRLQRHGARGGEGLEVGSYAGSFLTAAAGSRWRFTGLDVNPCLTAFMRSMGLSVHDGELDDFDPGRTFDAVAIWNTFDQLPAPRTVLAAVARLLRAGGVLALRVPNGECYARWRPRLDGAAPTRAFATRLLAYNNLLSFPYRFGYTPASLTRLLDAAGFAVSAVVGDVLVPVHDRWTHRWAIAEAAMMKPLTRRWMPWFEVYATRR